MNDPGLDVPIQENSKAEDEYKAEKEIEKEDEQAFLNPRLDIYTRFKAEPSLIPIDSRWWFASTAFPLLAVCNQAQNQYNGG